jgi:hypothetical protein
MSTLLKTQKDKKQFKTWLKALRSDEYKQAKYTLQNATGYCCLGVACEVLIPQKQKGTLHGILYGGIPQDQPHAPNWLKKINLDFDLKTNHTLSELNDGNNNLGLQFGFQEIADLLELVYIHNILKRK